MNELLGRNATRPPSAKHRVAESRGNRAHPEMPRGNGRRGEMPPQAGCRETMRAQSESRDTVQPKALVLNRESEANTTRCARNGKLPRSGSNKRTVAA